MLIEANSQNFFVISRNKCNKFVWSSMMQQHRICIDLPNTKVGTKNWRKCMVSRGLHHVPREHDALLMKPSNIINFCTSHNSDHDISIHSYYCLSVCLSALLHMQLVHCVSNGAKYRSTELNGLNWLKWNCKLEVEFAHDSYIYHKTRNAFNCGYLDGGCVTITQVKLKIINLHSEVVKVPD